MQDIETLESEILTKISAAGDLDALEAVRIAALGKKGEVSLMMRGLGQMAPEERQVVAPKLNKMKQSLLEAIDQAKDGLNRKAMEEKLATESIDITLAARPESQGRIHPISQVVDEITEIFADMGFTIAEGPDIEDDFHNFTALNIPPEHPARQMHDTFYLPEKEDGSRQLLRTHTSSVQIRTMMSEEPPHRIVVPGRTYRSDSDQTHTPMFNQIEGLVIDKTSHMGHLKGVLKEFCRAFFEVDNVEMRFRPSYFPFTEPSAEMDIRCTFAGDHIKIGEGDDWMEILGCGMVNPRVLEHCGLDPKEYQGFAWGMGIDRIAMLKYGIPDLRAFFDCDLRWLKHYGFVPLDVPTIGGGLSR
ncbi:MAG: phenylalanine--tRNA ligase subunit alpha [Sneathiellales bacterium]|nr:phenylalanine--tRNA ligase subunit alpha [Sneathiellales bacterium]